MANYIIRRLLLLIPTLLIVTVIVFATVRLIPGDAVDVLMAQTGGGGGATEESRARLQEMLGLDVPAHVQYARWLWDLARGDLGGSLFSGEPVWSAFIVPRIPVTLELSLMAMAVALLTSVPVGVYSAIRQDTVGDYLGRGVSILFISVPVFWTATMVMIYSQVLFRWTPRMEYIPIGEDLPQNLLMFGVPALILGLLLSGTLMRLTRSMMLEVLRQDYVRTAWAKGLRERVVIIRHALKNALIPVVTMIGLNVPYLIGGAVVVEQVFNLPGVGRLVVSSLLNRDYTIVSGVNLVVACAVLLVNLAVDLIYAYLDPRIRYE